MPTCWKVNRVNLSLAYANCIRGCGQPGCGGIQFQRSLMVNLSRTTYWMRLASWKQRTTEARSSRRSTMLSDRLSQTTRSPFQFSMMTLWSFIDMTASRNKASRLNYYLAMVSQLTLPKAPTSRFNPRDLPKHCLHMTRTRTHHPQMSSRLIEERTSHVPSQLKPQPNTTYRRRSSSPHWPQHQ